MRNAISETLRSFEKTNPVLYDAFTLELTHKEEEQEELAGAIEFFQTFETKKRKRINQTEFESVFHFVDRAIKNLKLIPYSYLIEKSEPTKQEAVQANARKNLSWVMKATIFKSFDSSIHTFRKRISKYETYLSNFEERFFRKKIFVRPEIIQKAISFMEDEPDEDVIDLIMEQVAALKYEKNASRKTTLLLMSGLKMICVSSCARRQTKKKKHSLLLPLKFLKQRKHIRQLLKILTSQNLWE